VQTLFIFKKIIVKFYHKIIQETYLVSFGLCKLLFKETMEIWRVYSQLRFQKGVSNKNKYSIGQFWTFVTFRILHLRCYFCVPFYFVMGLTLRSMHLNYPMNLIAKNVGVNGSVVVQKVGNSIFTILFAFHIHLNVINNCAWERWSWCYPYFCVWISTQFLGFMFSES
jgi:hypothetical protein